MDKSIWVLSLIVSVSVNYRIGGVPVSDVLILARLWHMTAFLKSLSRPAGVEFPIGELSDAVLISPEIRRAIYDGNNSRIGHLVYQGR
jgi:hypothetical protein